MKINKLLNISQAYYELNHILKTLNQYSIDIDSINDRNQAVSFYNSLLKEHEKLRLNSLHNLINLTQIIQNQKEHIKNQDKISHFHILGLDNQIVHSHHAYEQLSKVDFLINHLLISATAKKFSLMGEHLSTIHLLKDYLDTPDLKVLFNKYHLENNLISSLTLLSESLTYQKYNKDPYWDNYTDKQYHIKLVEEAMNVLYKKNKENTYVNLSSINHTNRLKEKLILQLILQGYTEKEGQKNVSQKIKSIFNYKSNAFLNVMKNELYDNSEFKDKLIFNLYQHLTQDILFHSLNEQFKSYFNDTIQCLNEDITINQKRKQFISSYQKEAISPTLLERIKRIKDKTKETKNAEFDKKETLHNSINIQVKYQ